MVLEETRKRLVDTVKMFPITQKDIETLAANRTFRDEYYEGKYDY